MRFVWINNEGIIRMFDSDSYIPIEFYQRIKKWRFIHQLNSRYFIKLGSGDQIIFMQSLEGKKIYRIIMSRQFFSLVKMYPMIDFQRVDFDYDDYTSIKIDEVVSFIKTFPNLIELNFSPPWSLDMLPNIDDVILAGEGHQTITTMVFSFSSHLTHDELFHLLVCMIKSSICIAVYVHPTNEVINKMIRDYERIFHRYYSSLGTEGIIDIGSISSGLEGNLFLLSLTNLATGFIFNVSRFI